MRWKYSTNFIVSGQNGYVLLVDSRCEFTLRIDSVTQSHKGVYRCELDGESNDDTPKSAERTLSIARESGWLAGCLSVCLSISPSGRVPLTLSINSKELVYILTSIIHLALVTTGNIVV